MFSSSICENVFSLNVRSYIWSMFPRYFAVLLIRSMRAEAEIWPNVEFEDFSFFFFYLVFLLERMETKGLLLNFNNFQE